MQLYADIVLPLAAARLHVCRARRHGRRGRAGRGGAVRRTQILYGHRVAGPRPPARFQNRQTDPARALRCASALGAADVAVGVDRLVLHVFPGGGDARGAACADETFGRHGGGVLRRRVPSPHRVLRVAGCGTPRRGAFSRSLREDRTARPEAVRGAARAGCGRRRDAHRDGRGGPPPAPGRLCRAARPRAQEIHRLHPARTFGRARRVGLPPSGADGAPADGAERLREQSPPGKPPLFCRASPVRARPRFTST